MYLGGLRDAISAQDMLRKGQYSSERRKLYLMDVIEQGIGVIEGYRERGEL